MNKFVCIKKEDKVEIRLGNVENHSDLVLPKETCTNGRYKSAKGFIWKFKD